MLLMCIIVFMTTGSATCANNLKLQQKVSVIKAPEKVPKPSIRELAQEFNCGKTRISTVIQNKHEILDMYETNASGEIYLARKRIGNSMK